jgi:hypothetical protein
MTDAAGNGVVREVLREVLAELLPQVVEGALEERAAGAAGPPPAPPAGGAVARVPAPPVAAVHRPSTWQAPPGTAPAPAEGAGGPGAVEEVAIASDGDLDAFVRRLLRLYENPRDRELVRSGRLRFTLRRTAAGDGRAATAALRIVKGAVTERLVDAAADQGARLVLGPRAVLTPMARDRAKKLRVEIEKEKRC